jgi:hypothetical protein
MRVLTVVCSLVSLAAIFGLVFHVDWGSAPHDLVSKVPLDSSLADLDRYLVRGTGSIGEVREWTPNANDSAGSGRKIQNEFGRFRESYIGDYDAWKATTEERNRFTGEIDFFHHGSTSSDMNSFVYVNGKLKKKDWGFLPG